MYHSRSRFSTSYQQSVDKCIDFCVHQDIYDWMIRTAREDQQHLERENKGRPSYKDYSPDNFFIGSLAQNGFFFLVEQVWGFQFDHKSPFYIPQAGRDPGYDFIYRDRRVDIQGEPFRKNPTTGQTASVVHKGTRFYISQNKINDEECDGFLLCKVDVPRNMLHFAGLIGFYSVERLETNPGSGGDKPCKIVTASALEEDVRKFIFAT